MSRKWLWLLLPALVLVGAAVWFGFRFVTRLAEYPRVADTLPAELSAARRNGLPLSPADLRPSPPVLPSQNAAPLYRRIDAAFRARQSLADADGATAGAFLRPNGRGANRQKVRAALARWEPQMRLAEQAAGRAGCDFARDWKLGPSLLLPEFASMRLLARFLAARAILESKAGRPDAALRTIAVGAKVGRHMSANPLAIALLMHLAVQAIMDRSFIRVVVMNKDRPGILRLAADTNRAFGPPPNLRHALSGEVVMCNIMSEMLRDRSKPRPPLSFLSSSGGARQIAGDAWQARMLSYWRRVFAALRANGDDMPALSHALKALADQQDANANKPTYEMGALLMPVFSKIPLKMMQGEEQARLRQTLLALVLYRQKTGGYPSNLAALSSPAPSDIFTGRPPLYRKTADGFLLYSVGEDGRDDGGKSFPGKAALDIVVSDPAL